jgi:Transposase DDE domain group 1
VLAPTGTVYSGPGGGNMAEWPATAATEGVLVLSGSSSIAAERVRVVFDGGRLTSDAGVLLLADVERRLRLAELLARCLVRPGKTPDGIEVTLVLRHVIKRIRARWPKVDILIRGAPLQKLVPAATVREA